MTIYHADCREVLPELPKVDLVVTDPPYGMAFMGKDWDKVLPDPAIWRECLRVLKPGAFAFVMSSPRADLQSRMIASLEGAGFNVGFTPIYWAYASGFPKAQNIGKAVDKRNGRQDSFAPFAKHYGSRRAALGYTHAFICEQGHFYDEYNHGGASVNWEQGHNVPTLAQWGVLMPLLGLSLGYLPLIEREEAVREVTGKDKTRSLNDNIPFAGRGEFDRKDKPATPQAQALDGSYAGFQPKPAVEVIIVAMKPLSEKTYVDQALANGHGVTWFDAGRIPLGEEYDPTKVQRQNSQAGIEGGGFKDDHVQATYNKAGRFPANLLCSDDVLDDGKVRKSGTLEREYESESAEYVYGEWTHRSGRAIADAGSFSRYFDLDAWWAERIKSLPESVQRTFPFLEVTKASKREKGEGNDHPTVKPLKLMSYLIELGSRPGDLVLDPFCGSGSTVVSGVSMGRKVIGIDIEERSCAIATNRCRQMVMGLGI
ncbi:hypothetical protein LCGC14_0567410 [marine sediment metagenome]|uniref:DNA methylase N-4/N-6 domain-containing protein n=1 Tax=marine sediment metagenome TaxID=412755 RepID=A0A0F9UTD8_9ZZZZ